MANQIIEELKTPTELLELFPLCEYNHREVGYLLLLGLVDGVKTKYGCLITVTSFEELLNFKRVYGRSKYKFE